MNTEEISYIILSFILISTFIVVFFYTYVSSVESDIIQDQIQDVIENFLSVSNLFLTDSQKEEIGKDFIAHLNSPDMKEADRNAEINNKKLIKKSILIFSIIFGIGIISLILLKFFKKYSIINVLTYSLIILILVAMTEFIFVTFVIKNYRIIDPNYVSYLLATNLESYKGK